MNRLSKLATIMVFTGLIIWLIETWYFGWNSFSHSLAESICDWVSIALILGGFIIKPVNQTTNIYTKKVELNCK